VRRISWEIALGERGHHAAVARTSNAQANGISDGEDLPDPGVLHDVLFVVRGLYHDIWAKSPHHRVPPAGFKYLVTEMVCWATGGPQKYMGKSMAESHKDLKITSKEWEAFLDDFQQTLDKFAVRTEEQTELKTIVNSTRSDIVVD
jgi:hypothetical protein